MSLLNMDLKGKVAIVTGGANGIGLSIVKELLENDIKGVVIADINMENGKKTVQELTKKYKSDKILLQETDVTNKDSFEGAFKATLAKFGQIDIVVNNAGIADETKYEKLIETNLTGVITGTVLAMKYMGKDQGGNGGAVLSISSILSVWAFPYLPIYSATKGGVLNLMLGFGDTLHYKQNGIRMFALLPGMTPDTNIDKDMKFYKELSKELNLQAKPQKVSSVGRSAIHILKHGQTASAWLVKEDKLFKLNFPEWTTYAKLAIDY